MNVNSQLVDLVSHLCVFLYWTCRLVEEETPIVLWWPISVEAIDRRRDKANWCPSPGGSPTLHQQWPVIGFACLVCDNQIGKEDDYALIVRPDIPNGPQPHSRPGQTLPVCGGETVEPWDIIPRTYLLLFFLATCVCETLSDPSTTSSYYYVWWLRPDTCYPKSGHSVPERHWRYSVSAEWQTGAATQPRKNTSLFSWQMAWHFWKQLLFISQTGQQLTSDDPTPRQCVLNWDYPTSPNDPLLLCVLNFLHLPCLPSHLFLEQCFTVGCCWWEDT